MMKKQMIMAGLILGSVCAHAQTWTGNGGDGKWGTGANWSTGSVPASNGNVQFQNTGPLEVSVEANTQVQQIHASGSGNVTVNIANNVTLTVSNGGSTGARATGANLTFNGPGRLAFSWGSNGDLLDNGASAGRTLTLNAEVVGIGANPLSTGIEAYIGGQPNNGTVVMGYHVNAFTSVHTRITGHVLVAPTLANAGVTSSVGAGREFQMNYLGTLRYTGPGASTDRAILLVGGNGGQIDHSGTGPLVFSGGMSNSNNSVQELVLLGDSASDATITGPIANGVGMLALRKEGSGTWILSGNNTFTGSVTVNGGTLGLDSPTAVAGVSLIVMVDGSTLAVNPSGAASFTATLPMLKANGGTLFIGGASSTVILGGLAGNALDVAAAPGNTIFITDFPVGLAPLWLTLNGGPAEYDATFGLIPASAFNTLMGFKTKGDFLPNGALHDAYINLIGAAGDPAIALTADPTSLYRLTLTADDDAEVDTAGKTLYAGTIANDSAANTLSIGVVPKDGLLLPQAPIYDSTVISNLNPVIWYDPSDVSTVTLSGGTVTGLANKGSGGSAMNAVVRNASGFSAPLYVTGAGSDSSLPMVKIAADGQGLQSGANTGITGSNPRTLIAVMSRATASPGFDVSFGNPANNQWFALFHNNNGNSRFSIYGTDHDLPRPPNNVPVVLSILNGVGGNNSTWRGYQNKNPSGTATSTSMNTANTVLSMGYRPNGSSNAQRGQFGEVLLFNKSLTDSEREAVEDYLLAKWQSPPSLLLRSGADAPVIVNAAITEPPGSAVSLIKSGPGDITLAGGATLSGPVTISDGTLILDTPLGLTDTLADITRGPGKLVKTGDGTLVRPASAANTYSGGTDILGGTLRVGNNASLGTGPVTVANGATLDTGLGATDFSASNPFVISGTGVGGLGALINSSGNNQQNAFRFTTVTLADDTTIGGNGGRWDIRGSETTLDLNNRTLTKAGTSDVRLSGNLNIVNAPVGTAIDVQKGTLYMESAINLSPNTPDQTIILGDGGTFGMYNLTAPVNWSIVAENNSTITHYGGTTYSLGGNVLDSGITLNGTLNLTKNNNNADIFFKTLTGKISGTGGLFVYCFNNYGNQSVMNVLANTANDFSGSVVVSNATLGLRYPGSLPDAAKLTVASNVASGVRVFAGGDRWSGSEIAAVANSGRFTANNQRFGIIVGQGEEASLGTITSAFNGEMDFFGPGTLALDEDVGPLTRYTRVFGGTLVFTNNATFSSTNNVYVKDGNDWDNAIRMVNVIVGGEAKITLTDRGYNQGSPFLNLGQNGNAVLDLKDNAYIQTRLQVGWSANVNGAIYQSGGTFLSSGGANSIAIIGNTGHGYYQIDDGDFTMKGFTVLGAVNNTSSVGIIRQTGGAIAFNGMRYPLPANNVVGDSYGGQLEISRNGKGVLHLEGGTFEHYGPLAIIGNGTTVNNAFGTMTVTGTADAFVDRAIDMGWGTAGNAGVASLNLNGGTLTAASIQRRNFTGARANVNFNGGLLRVTGGNTGLLTRENNTAAAFNAYVYSGGARIEIPEGLSRTVDIPLERPAGRGVSAINTSNGGSGYIAPPYVHIKDGGGNGATAIASINRTTGQVTGIEITNPGTGYTSAPTVEFIGGGGTAPSSPTAVIAPNVEGGLTKTGGGTLILNAPCTYRGDTVVEEGVLVLARADAIHPDSHIIIGDGTLNLGGNTVSVRNITVNGTGSVVNGKLITSSAVKTGSGTATWDAAIEFDTIDSETDSGLWEGTRLDGALNLTSPNSCVSIQQTTTAANGYLSSSGSINGKTWINNSTFVYTGYIWNRNGTNETWTFAKSFDDGIHMTIDGTVYINHEIWNQVFKTNVVITPGPHPIEIRFGQGSGGVGARDQTTSTYTDARWWTSATIPLGVDYFGRNQTVLANYVRLDADDGYRLTLTPYGGPLPPKDSAIHVLEGSLNIPSETPAPGLYEGYLTGTQGSSSIDLSTSNPNDGVELTTTAANGHVGSVNMPINGKPWVANSTYVYTGYIWNRNGTNENWTFVKSFDDAIHMTIDGIVYVDHTKYDETFKTNVVVTPGAHPIEIRFGQGSGGVGAMKQTTAGNEWWTSNTMPLGVDYLGRDQNVIANYIPLFDPGDGSRLTLTADGYQPTTSVGIPVDVYASMDLGDQPRPGTSISPAGDLNVGTAQVSGTGNNALNGVTYRVTVHGSESDTIAFTDSGPIDLTGLTIKPSDLPSETLTGNKHVIATAPDGFIGTPVLDGFDPKWKTRRQGNELWLTTISGTILMIR